MDLLEKGAADIIRVSDLRERLEDSRKRLNNARLRVASFDFRAKIGVLRLRLQRLTQELGVREERVLRLKRERWGRLLLQLQERSPLKVLERGYAIATDAAGNVLRSVDSVSPGDIVSVRLLDGSLGTLVKDKRKNG